MYASVKRILDVGVSVVALIILSPLFIIVALIIKVDSPGGVFFKQKRSGKDRVPFMCYKFRTMSVDAPHNRATCELKGSKSYITRPGKILRRLGIDELPQLFNVLKGEMSLIGPRPVILKETKLLDERDKYGANAMVPGIGGWAQSNGRDEIDYKTKARLDGEYTQNFGWRMDASCVWRTVVAIFTSEGFREGGLGDDKYKKNVEVRTRVLHAHRYAIRNRHTTKGKSSGLKGAIYNDEAA